jgi:hypothetical protein
MTQRRTFLAGPFQPSTWDWGVSDLKTTAFLTADLKAPIDRKSYKNPNFLQRLFKEVSNSGYGLGGVEQTEIFDTATGKTALLPSVVKITSELGRPSSWSVQQTTQGGQ